MTEDGPADINWEVKNQTFSRGTGIGMSSQEETTLLPTGGCLRGADEAYTTCSRKTAPSLANHPDIRTHYLDKKTVV